MKQTLPRTREAQESGEEEIIAKCMKVFGFVPKFDDNCHLIGMCRS